MVRDLVSRGVVFDLDHEGRLALGLEGGPAARRIVHAGGSQTGHELTSKLAAMVATESRIEVLERTSALSLWSDGERCHGVIPTPARSPPRRRSWQPARRRALEAHHQLAGGDRRRMVFAAAAGADLADLEFCQFHPTALSLPGTGFDGG